MVYNLKKTCNWHSIINNYTSVRKKIAGDSKLKKDPQIPQGFQRDICISMFIAALFIIAKIKKQLKCPSIDEWIKQWYIYVMEYHLAIIKEDILSFETHGWGLITLYQY